MTGNLDNRRAPGKGNTLYRPPNKRRPGGEEEGQGDKQHPRLSLAGIE